MTTEPLAPVHTTHLEPLFALNDAAINVLIGMVGSHYVSHGSLDRATLVRYMAEAEAIAS
jgi:hypothetical protein